MRRETWKRVEELFEAALAEPPERGEQFLGTACSDDSCIRAEILSLLRSGETAESFLEDSPLCRRTSLLERGQKLGHFEIIELIGSGGMGHVYRARDTRLKREAAIKVLPAEFARDPAGILRFEREARAASSLNHPNIVCVYEVGREGQQYWIVCELVRGQTLREIINRGALPARRAIEVALQVAEGLAAAHAAGVVHRDLNPANVMISSEGRVKILDFGLAKRCGNLLRKDESIPGPVTTPGLVLGTPGYMAPEQITGTTADHRSDIFALGAILQEMRSGERAFSGKSTVDVLNANLNSEPSPLPSSVPPALQRITLRCLEKEPSKRFQSATDLGFALAGLLEIVSGASPAAPPKPLIRWTWSVYGLAAVMLIAGGDYGLRRMLGTHVGEANAVMTRLTTDSGLTTDGAISLDGKLVAFASDRAGSDDLDIFVKQVDGPGSAVRLTTDPADDYDPTFSRDGTRIAFRSERNGGGVYDLSTLGGEARLLVSLGRRPRFSPDGQFLLYWTGPVAGRGSPSGKYASLFVQPTSGGRPLRVGTDRKDIDSTAVWSPDSRYVLFEGPAEIGAPSGLLT